jgi:hypothetical protein
MFNIVGFSADGKSNRKDKAYHPSPASALDDAAHLNGFTFDGNVCSDPSVYVLFFTLSSISVFCEMGRYLYHKDRRYHPRQWEVLGNSTELSVCIQLLHVVMKWMHAYSPCRYTKVGACQQLIEAGDDVLFAFDAFNKKHFLKLIGPTTTTVGVPITVTVIDGTTDVPIADATVGGQKTDARGRATLVFRSPGNRELKAERAADSIRSNALCVKVLRWSTWYKGEWGLLCCSERSREVMV